MEIEASQLTQKTSKVHFHWGSAKGQGSEHTIEGKQHDLEMHMVHTNTAYETDKAANYKDGYLVVGVLFDEAKGNKIRVRVICLFQDYQSNVSIFVGVRTNFSQFCEKIQQASGQ